MMQAMFTRANVARTLLLAFFLLFTFVPLYWMAITSIKPSDDYLAVPPVWFPAEDSIPSDETQDGVDASLNSASRDLMRQQRAALIEQHRTVVLMTETHPSTEPWLTWAFGGLLKDTPYSFGTRSS